MSEALLRILATQSAAGAALILAMLGLRRLLSDKVPHRLIYGLWLVVALRMLIPWELPGVIRLDRPANVAARQTYVAHTVEAVGVTADGTASVEQAAAYTFAPPAAQTSAQPAQVDSPRDTRSHGTAPWSISKGLATLWMGGAILSACYMALVNRRFRRRAFAGAVALSAKSPIPVLLADVLAEFAKPEFQYQSDYGIPLTMLLEDTAPYSRVHYDAPDYCIPRYTPKMEALRQFAAGKWISWNMKLHPVDILGQTDALPRYLEGGIAIDEFIRMIQEKADMIQYE